MNPSRLREKSDEALMREARGGNLSSFEALVKKYQERVFYYTLGLLKDGDKAEDATQETFVRVFKNLESFDQSKKLKPWLYRIATNLCMDVFRKGGREIPINEFVKIEEEEPVGEMIKKERLRFLKNALSNLPKIYKDLLEGHYLENRNYKSLARLHALPVNTVKTRMRRARMILKRQLYGKI